MSGVGRKRGQCATYIVVAIFGEYVKPLLQKGDHLLRHLVQIMDQRIPIHIAEARPHRIVHKQHVGELIPPPLLHPQRPILIDSIRPNLHQRPVHRAAPGPAVEPDHRPLLVRDVPVLEEPEEEIPVVLGRDLDVAGVHLEEGVWRSREGVHVEVGGGLLLGVGEGEP